MTRPATARRSDALPADYPQFLAEIKARIAAARTHAALAVNSELIQLYWEIGHEILEREQREGWGSGVINRLASDLRREFPSITGFSRSNLHYMRSFAEAWPLVGGSQEIVQQPVGQLPWGQNIALVTRLEDRDARVWYAASAVENGWSRKVLEAQIATDLRGRQGGALTSFDHALPESDSELVRDAIKDPYNFEFLGLAGRAKERDLEQALLNDIQSFSDGDGPWLRAGRPTVSPRPHATYAIQWYNADRLSSGARGDAPRVGELGLRLQKPRQGDRWCGDGLGP